MDAREITLSLTPLCYLLYYLQTFYLKANIVMQHCCNNFRWFYLVFYIKVLCIFTAIVLLLHLV